MILGVLGELRKSTGIAKKANFEIARMPSKTFSTSLGKEFSIFIQNPITFDPHFQRFERFCKFWFNLIFEILKK